MKHKVEISIICLIFLFIAIQVSSFVFIFLAIDDASRKLEKIMGNSYQERCVE